MQDEPSNSHNRPDDSHKRKLSMNHVSAICFDKCHHYLLEIIEDIQIHWMPYWDNFRWNRLLLDNIIITIITIIGGLRIWNDIKILKILSSNRNCKSADPKWEPTEYSIIKIMIYQNHSCAWISRSHSF